MMTRTWIVLAAWCSAVALPVAASAQLPASPTAKSGDSLAIQLPDLSKLSAALAAEAHGFKRPTDPPAPLAPPVRREQPPSVVAPTKDVGRVTRAEPQTSAVTPAHVLSEPKPQAVLPTVPPASAFLLLFVGGAGAIFGALVFGLGVQMGRSTAASPASATHGAGSLHHRVGTILGTLLNRRSDTPTPPRVSTMIPKRRTRAFT